MLFLHFGWYFEQYWANSEKFKCILLGKTPEIWRKQYLSIFWDFSGGFRCVLEQLVLIQTSFSVKCYIKREAVLSSIRWYNYFVCRTNRFRVMMDFVRDLNKFQILWRTTVPSLTSRFPSEFGIMPLLVPVVKCGSGQTFKGSDLEKCQF